VQGSQGRFLVTVLLPLEGDRLDQTAMLIAQMKCERLARKLS